MEWLLGRLSSLGNFTMLVIPDFTLYDIIYHIRRLCEVLIMRSMFLGELGSL